MKESFLIYKSFYEPISGLSDEDLGRLFRAVFEYQLKGIEPTNTDRIYIAFQFFKNQFRLDDIKYNKIVERNKSNGHKGGRPKTEQTQINPNNPVDFYEPKKADNENENENEKENDNDNVNDKESRVPATAGQNYFNQSEDEFIDEMRKYEHKYTRDTLNSFYQYWSEKNKSGKMRYQNEKTWELGKRLALWDSRNKKNGTKQLPASGGGTPFQNFIHSVEEVQKNFS